MSIESYIRKTEALLAAEKLKEGRSQDFTEGFDTGANWLKSFTDELLKESTPG